MAKIKLTLEPHELLAVIRLNQALIEAHIQKEDIDGYMQLCCIRDDLMRSLDGDMITNKPVTFDLEAETASSLVASVGLFIEFLKDTEGPLALIDSAKSIVNKFMPGADDDDLSMVIADHFVVKSKTCPDDASLN